MLGAQNADSKRQRGMMGKQRWQSMVKAYEQFRQQDRLPATYEVVYGHAWRPAELKARQRSVDGEVFVPVDLVGRQ